MATPVEQFEGKYEILEKIAEGGMGSVYKVRHRLLDVIRVIKVMRPQIEAQQGTKERFLREARLAIKMRHTNIAQLDDFAMDDDGNAYIVMEYIDGITLQEVLQKLGPPPLPLALEVARQSLLSLGYLHQKKVVHRDISPDNLMLARDESGEPLVKLIDLGIAKALQADAAGLTATGMFVGKVRYASPEHFRTEEGAQVDQCSDLYSFGVVLYELFTGTHPIAGESFSTLIAGHLFRPPMDFSESDPDGKVPDDLRGIVLKSMAKAPEERYPNARAFADAIAEIQTRFPLAREIFDYYFDRRKDELPTMRMQRPGSTQDRLDVEFKKSMDTPTPEDYTLGRTAVEPDRPPTKSGAPVAVEAGTDERTGALVQAAQRLVQLKLYKEARVQLGSVLQLDSNNAEAAELLLTIEDEETRAEALAVAVAAGERLLEDGALDRAQQHVESALAELGAAKELDTLRSRILQRQEEIRAAAVQQRLDEAGALLADSDFAGAMARLEEARGLDPGNPDVTRRIAELEKAERAARRREEEERRAVRVAELIEQAQANLDGGEHAEAVGKLREALKLSPGDRDLQGRLAEATRALKHFEKEKKRENALAGVAAEVERLVGSGDLVAARVAVKAARVRLGDCDELTGLAEQVDGVERKGRKDEAEALSREAQGLLAEGDYEGAIAKLKDGVAADPGNQGLSAQLLDARNTFKQVKREARISGAVAEVEAHIERNRLETALAAAKKAITKLGKTEELVEVRERVKALQALADVERGGEEDEDFEVGPADLRAQLPTMEELEEDDTKPMKKVEQAAPAAEEAEEAEQPEEPEESEESQESQDTEPIVRQEPQHVSVTPKPWATPESTKDTSIFKVDSTMARRAEPVSTARKKIPLWAIIGAGAAAVVFVAVLLISFLGGEGEPVAGGPRGTLVIHALPWAEVVKIVDEAENEQELPSERFTPLNLALPPGRYTATLTNPSSAEPVILEVEVRDGETVGTRAEFAEPDAKAFLESFGVR